MLPPSWKSEVQKAIEEKIDSDNEQRQTQTNNAASKITTAIETISNAQNTQTAHDDRYQKTNVALNVVTIFLVFCTVAFTYKTWQVMTDQVGEMRKVYGPIKESADAAKAAADATSKQAGSAEKQVVAMQGQLDEMRAQRLINIAQTRANLVRDAVAHAHTDSKKLAAAGERIVEYSFSPLWKNTGSTEARAWRAWFDLKVFDIGPTIPRHLGSDDCPGLDTPDPLPDERIVSKDGVVIQLAKFVSIDDLVATTGDTATKFALMWGHMEFQDIYFPETLLHSDDWCVSVAPADLRQQSFSYISLKEVVK